MNPSTLTHLVSARCLALLDGGPAPETGLLDLGQALVRAAGAPGTQGLCFVAADGTETSLSYAGLLRDASRVLAALRAAGTAPGETVLLQIDRAPQLLAAFWGCLLGGFVPLPVPAHGAADHALDAPALLHRVWTGHGRPRVITAAGGRLAPETTADLRWTEAHLGEIAVLLRHSPDNAHHRARPDDLAVLLLTSGSTGAPRAVALSHRNVLSRSAATIAANGLSRATRSFNWMPLEHVGGLVMFHLRDVVLGCHQVHARTDWIIRDPLRWLAAVDRHRANTTWAPNFAFALVNDRAEQLRDEDWDLSCLRYIMNGGEAVRAPVVRTFLDLLAPHGLPGNAMRPGWGMSETSSGVVDCDFATDCAGDERYVPVGRPQPGTAIRIVDDADRVVRVGTTGHLQVSGPTVTRGHYEAGVLNADCLTRDGWLRTGDLGHVRDGVLAVTGRADDAVCLGGATYHGHEIEAVVEELAFVEPSYTVASAVTGPTGREELAVFFHPRTGEAGPAALAAVRARVRDRLGVDVRHVVAVDRGDVPKTGVGKLRRSQLRNRFEQAGAALGSAAG